MLWLTDGRWLGFRMDGGWRVMAGVWWFVEEVVVVVVVVVCGGCGCVSQHCLEVVLRRRC